MSRLTGWLLAAALLPATGLAHMKDDPLLAGLTVDRLEWREGQGADALAFAIDGWLGRDLHKLHLNTEGERVDGDFHKGKVQALYSQAVTPFWDIHMGWQGDLRPTPDRHWLAMGVDGLAPGWIALNATLLIGDHGRTGLDLDADYDLRLTRRWVLTPAVEARLYGHNDPAAGSGSGLADIEAGLRLRYEIRPELSPYIGVHHQRRYGNTADYARQRGERVSATSLVVGVRLWF